MDFPAECEAKELPPAECEAKMLPQAECEAAPPGPPVAPRAPVAEVAAAAPAAWTLSVFDESADFQWKLEETLSRNVYEITVPKLKLNF